ncbi:MAG: hypothetical protein ACYS67_09120 [Planctomycetota bacterium]|jgi:hypothetical protein
MEMDCKFCHEKIEVKAKKCKVCGEPYYLIGKVLKLAPLLSIVITLLSLGLAYFGVSATKRAFAVTREMHIKDKAAELAIREIAGKLPPDAKNKIIKEHRLQNSTTLGQLEREAKKSPENSELQRRVYLFRALNKPD